MGTLLLIGFAVGRFGGDQFARRHGHWVGMGAQRLEQASALFLRWAVPSLLLSRSLIAIVAPAINLLSGASALGLRSFIFYTTIGRLTWLAIFVGLGYVFAVSADTAADFASSLSGVLGLLIVAGLLLAASRCRSDSKRTAPCRGR